MSMPATHSRFKFEWNDENVERLKEGLKAGVQIKRIAADLGCSPMAVVGKAHRLGLRGPRDARVKAKAKSVPKAAKIIEQHAVRQILAERPPEPQLPAIEPTAEGAGVSLMELAYYHCRAPIPQNAGPIRYCGKLKADGSSYCPGHRRLFTQQGNR